MFNKEPSKIALPYNREQLDAFQMFDDDWQIAIGNYCGQILHHLPSHALLIQKLKKDNLNIVFPPSDFTTCSLCNKLNADLFGTIRCKTVDKVKRSPPDNKKILTQNLLRVEEVFMFFSQGADSSIWIPDRLIRHKRKRELLCRHRRGKQPHRKPRAGPALLTDGT